MAFPVDRKVVPVSNQVGYAAYATRKRLRGFSIHLRWPICQHSPSPYKPIAYKKGPTNISLASGWLGTLELTPRARLRPQSNRPLREYSVYVLMSSALGSDVLLYLGREKSRTIHEEEFFLPGLW